MRKSRAGISVHATIRVCMGSNLSHAETNHILATNRQVCDGYYYASEIHKAIKTLKEQKWGVTYDCNRN